VTEPLKGTVDISERGESPRRAVAEGFLVADPATIEAVRAGALPKGDPVATARTAGLLAVKRTPGLIPHCHPVRVTAAALQFEFSANAIRVACEVRAIDRTGPEMEAMHGVAAALLTLYDMVKGRCPTAMLRRIGLLEKEGGRDGHWRAERADA